jgi:hypothetical protein
MRNTNSQRAGSMIPVSVMHQPSAPHVRHAEIEGCRSKPFSGEVGTGTRAENASKYKPSDQDGQRCALLTTKSRKTCTRATLFNSSG